MLARAGLPVIEHRLCKHEDEVLAAQDIPIQGIGRQAYRS